MRWALPVSKAASVLCFVSTDPVGAVRSVDLHCGGACCTFPDRARHKRLFRDGWVRSKCEAVPVEFYESLLVSPEPIREQTLLDMVHDLITTHLMPSAVRHEAARGTCSLFGGPAERVLRRAQVGRPAPCSRT
jgi:hypothetical protein